MSSDRSRRAAAAGAGRPSVADGAEGLVGPRRASRRAGTDGEQTGREAIDAYMAYTLEMVRKYPERFIGCFVYNPRCGVANGVEAIERYHKEHGFKMVQMQADIHAYRPDRAKDWAPAPAI